MKPVRPDRLRDVVDAVLEALDEGLDGPALAAPAMLSPFHFNRLVRAGIGEPSAAFRRRLLLERAAWRLGRGVTVTEASLEAGFDAVEAFSRAFSRAFGVPPSRFAGAPRDFRLAAPDAIHFHPPGGLLLPGQHARAHRLHQGGRSAAIGGCDIPSRDARGIAELQARLSVVEPQFAALVRRIRDRNE